MSLQNLTRALESRRDHLSAFLMLGDPSPDVSVALAVAAVEAGATMLELGIPFSDPCADGPVIQRSCQRAREGGLTTDGAIGILARIHAAVPDVPLNLLVYGNLVHARGYGRFCDDVVAAGAATLLVPDIPHEESGELRAAAAAADLGHVSLVAPLTDPDRLRVLDADATGFLYLAGYQGVTGASGETVAHIFPPGLTQAQNPVCLGFGVSTPEHVAAGFANGARMVVVGSHLARAIEAALPGDPTAALRAAVQPLAAVADRSNHEPRNTTKGTSQCS